MASSDTTVAVKSITSTVAVTNTTTETALISVALPNDVIDADGSMLRVQAAGIISSRGTADDVVFRLRHTSTAGTTLLSITTNDDPIPVNMTNAGWFLEMLLVTNTSGTVDGGGVFSCRKPTTTGFTLCHARPTATVAATTSGAVTVLLSVAWGVANASNSITCRTAIMEVTGLTS